MAEKEYQKLPGRGMRNSGLFSVSRSMCSLYLGNDHLLQVDLVGGYSEEYKRFYFRDIQAITVRKTQTAAMALSFTGVFGIILTLIARASSYPVVAGIFYGIGGSLLFIFLILGVFFALRGGSCICYLKTAVQTEQLPSLKRNRIARKVLARIQPLIEQAQGSLAPDEMKAQMENYLQNPPSPPVNRSAASFRSTQTRPNPSAATASYTGKFHTALFSLLLAVGMMSALHVFFHPAWFVAFETVFSLALIFVVIAALVKQSSTNVSPALRKVTQVALGYLCVSSLLGYAVGTVMTASNPETAGNQWAIIEVYSSFEPLESMWLLTWLLVSTLVSVALGAMGLFLLKRWRSEESRVTASPPQPVDHSAL